MNYGQAQAYPEPTPFCRGGGDFDMNEHQQNIRKVVVISLLTAVIAPFGAVKCGEKVQSETVNETNLAAEIQASFVDLLSGSPKK